MLYHFLIALRPREKNLVPYGHDMLAVVDRQRLRKIHRMLRVVDLEAHHERIGFIERRETELPIPDIPEKLRCLTSHPIAPIKILFVAGDTVSYLLLHRAEHLTKMGELFFLLSERFDIFFDILDQFMFPCLIELFEELLVRLAVKICFIFFQRFLAGFYVSLDILYGLFELFFLDLTSVSWIVGDVRRHLETPMLDVADGRLAARIPYLIADAHFGSVDLDLLTITGRVADRLLDTDRLSRHDKLRRRHTVLHPELLRRGLQTMEYASVLRGRERRLELSADRRREGRGERGFRRVALVTSEGLLVSGRGFELAFGIVGVEFFKSFFSNFTIFLYFFLHIFSSYFSISL